VSHQAKCRDCHTLLGFPNRGARCEKCERKARGLPEVPKCIHCGKDCTADEGIVCEACYAKYTPGMLADLDQ
jgi:hypothetical protein